MKISGEIVGVLVAIGGTILMKVGFSEVCSNEIATTLPTAIGGLITYVSRVSKPDVNILGVKKD